MHCRLLVVCMVNLRYKKATRTHETNRVASRWNNVVLEKKRNRHKHTVEHHHDKSEARCEHPRVEMNRYDDGYHHGQEDGHRNREALQHNTWQIAGTCRVRAGSVLCPSPLSLIYVGGYLQSKSAHPLRAKWGAHSAILATKWRGYIFMLWR